MDWRCGWSGRGLVLLSTKPWAQIPVPPKKQTLHFMYCKMLYAYWRMHKVYMQFIKCQNQCLCSDHKPILGLEGIIANTLDILIYISWSPSPLCRAFCLSQVTTTPALWIFLSWFSNYFTLIYIDQQFVFILQD
jgi:hypothetical protein